MNTGSVNISSKLTSGTVVEYGVLMNLGVLSLISDMRTMTEMVFLLLVCLIMQLSC